MTSPTPGTVVQSPKPATFKQWLQREDGSFLPLWGAEAGAAGAAVGILLGQARGYVRTARSARAKVIGACAVGGAVVGAVAQSLVR